MIQFHTTRVGLLQVHGLLWRFEIELDWRWGRRVEPPA
jgi:hypothetical protein